MRSNNGRWMLAMLVCASLVAPGVVAAAQRRAAPVAPARAPSSELVDRDFAAAVEQVANPAAVSSCFNTSCTTHLQCRTRCNEPSAQCVQLPHISGKRCVLP